MKTPRERFMETVILIGATREQAEVLWDFAFAAGQLNAMGLSNQMRQAVKEAFQRASEAGPVH